MTAAAPQHHATSPHAGPGRPRAFDMDAAVAAGMAVIRREGYEAASLDTLTREMGISRSSFYAAFGSKRGVLLAALEHYSAARLRTLEGLAAGRDGLRRALEALAGCHGDAHGCLLVNCVIELCPRDAEVAALGAQHLGRIEAILAARLPEGADRATRAKALVAAALGAQTLRKGGEAPDAVAAALLLALDRLASA